MWRRLRAAAALLLAAAPAAAVPVGAPPPLLMQPVAAPLAASPARPQQRLRLDVPVAFQLTRTRLLGPGSTTLTESFRETWTIEVLPGALLNLRSPRAAVPAYDVGPHLLRPDVPKILLVSERDFALLVGVEPRGAAEVDDGETAAVLPSRPVSLTIGKSGRGGTDITLNWSEEEHYAVHIDVGTTSVF